MKRVWSGANLHDTVHLKNLLSLAGIETLLRNRDLGGALGDLPFLDCSPELWVVRDDDAQRASALLRDAVRPVPPSSGTAWRCAACGEDNEGQFAACWRCGANDPG